MRAIGKNKIIDFGQILLIVGNGYVDVELLLKFYRQGAPIIAADGGANICEKYSLIPKAIIGDMDSLQNKEKWANKTRLIALKEQESTDFEKCLYLTKAKISLAFGMSGNRLDHTLSAIDILAHYGRERKIILINQDDIAFTVFTDLTLSAQRGGNFSIFPLGKNHFANSQGLKYPLNGLTMKLGKKISISNQIIGDYFTIRLDKKNKNPYLLIMEKSELSNLLKQL